MSKKKISLAIIAVFAVLITSASLISYSIANKNSKRLNQVGADANSGSSNPVIGNLGNLEYISNIDLIIENSYKDENSTYNIVEIVPESENGPDDTNLKKYIDSVGFKNWVIDENAELEKKMADDKVAYTKIVCTSSTALADMCEDGTTTVGKAIDSADLIYVASPHTSSYNKTSNMSEAVFTKLEQYAITKGNHRPIIIDNLGGSNANINQARTYQVFANDVKYAWLNVLTFGWDRSAFTIGDFFIKNGQSKYIRYDVGQLGLKDDERTSGKILIISNNDENGDNPFYQALVDFGGTDGENIIEEAYLGNRKNRPEKITYTFMKPSELEENVEQNDRLFDETYDFVILEESIKTTEISDKAYRYLKTYSEKNNYLLYLKDWIVADGEDIIIDTESNFHALYNKLVSTDGKPNVSNVMLIAHDFFNKLFVEQANDKEDAKKIADLINGSVYRGHGGGANGSDNRMYRVLEIEPCYPVDTKLAESRGGNIGFQNAYQGQYYQHNYPVLYDYTADELDGNTDYYAFELTPAKIAHMTGLKVNQIAIDRMSTSQLISTKESLSHYYDLIYIGGDYSALTEFDKSWLENGLGNALHEYTGKKDKITGFDMYTHTGLLRSLNGVSPRNGSPIPSNASIAGNIVAGSTYAEMNGNDLTVTKRQQLVDYVDCGLPIIIDSKVSDAFIGAYKYDPEPVKDAEPVDGADPNRILQLSQRLIDPDSNMYSFLKYVYGIKKNAPNIAWGTVDAKATGATRKIDNTDKMYSVHDALAVTVYSEANETTMRNLINGSAFRPRLIVNSKPIEYVENGDNIINIGPTVTFDVSLLKLDPNDGDYTIKLLMDENGDGMYEEDAEMKDSILYTEDKSNATLSFDLDSDFSGAVSWKLLARNENGMCDMVTGIAYFKPDGEFKKNIRVLQIMPVSTEKQDMYQKGGDQYGNAMDDTDLHSLYFCTECQMTSKLAKYNVLVGKNGISGNMSDSLNNSGFGSRINKESVFGGKVKMGLHEHKFGIVKYGRDGATGELDDWDENLAYKLMHGEDDTLESGEYSFDLDILTNDQFDDIWEAAANRTDDEAEANSKLADKDKKTYEDILGDLTTDKLSVREEKLKEELFKAVTTDDVKNSEFGKFIVSRIGTKENPGRWILDKEYYKFFTYYNNDAGGIQASKKEIDSLFTAYNSYIELYDKVVEAKQAEKEHKRQAATLTNDWLTKNYDIVVLGFAEDFGGANLDSLSCDMLKEYIEKGEGSVLNTHDTMSRYKDAGSTTVTEKLRTVFGQDRFHAIGVGDSAASGKMLMTYKELNGYNKVRVYVGSANKNMVDNNDLSKAHVIETPIQVGDKYYGVIVNLSESGGIVDFSDPEPDLQNEVVNGNAKITFKGVSGSPSIDYMFEGERDPHKSTYVGSGNLVLTQKVTPKYKTTKTKVDIPSDNTTMTWDLSTNIVSDVTAGTSTTTTNYSVAVKVTNGSASVPSGTVISVKGADVDSDFTADANGVITVPFTVQAAPTGPTTVDLYAAPTDGTRYRKYATEDASKYFWTSRAIYDEDSQSLADWEKSVGYLLQYNSPIGMTDYFLSPNSQSFPNSPFRYALSQISNDMISGNPNASESYDSKYGSRVAEQVNRGAVTSYPFGISTSLKISATHAQFYALDLEDDKVSVWYTLGGDKPDNDGQKQARFWGSSFFAASPKDGMNNYFLYSKDNVFYCGAGHATVTGRGKENNDERRLFINIIVNAVTKGKSKMKLNLYNKCKKDENCDEFLVDKDEKTNAKLAKEEDTLFYDKTLKMYQYNVSEDEKYPEFDLKAISGSDTISKIHIYYDLDYTDLNSDLYDSATSPSHVEVVTYDKSDKKSDKRIRLRPNSTFEPNQALRDAMTNNLELKDNLFAPYGNYTYLVIDVENEAGDHATARVKINLIPKLFDLT